MKIIQNRSLPADWLQQVENFDVEKSSLSINNRIIAKTLIEFIEREEESSLQSPLARILISHIIFTDSLLTYYDCLPVDLLEDGLSELQGTRGIEFTRKLHSTFIEFITYIRFKDKGYVWKKTNRTDGSCDLFLEKNNTPYNIEVKFKESNDTFKSRLLDIIDGMSLHDEYSFTRGKKFEIHIKLEKTNDSERKEILKEVDTFLKLKRDTFEGVNIDIFNFNKRTELTRDINKVVPYLNSLEVSSKLTNTDEIYDRITKIFTNDGNHISKMSEKAKKIDNFYGCLVWSIQFHNKTNFRKIEKAFSRLQLEFDLYVFITGIDKIEYDFLVDKSTI